MKKVFLSFAVVACVALVSCGGNKAKEEAAEEQAAPVEEVVADAAVVEESVAPDSTVAETVVAVAAEPAQAQ